MHYWFSLLLSAWCISSFANEPLIICTEDKAYPPFINEPLSSTNASPGYAIDIVFQAANRSSIEVTIIRRPWKRCKQMVKQERAQALMPMINTLSRQHDFHFPNREQQLLNVEYYVFFHPQHQQARLLSKLTHDSSDVPTLQQNLRLGVAAPFGYVTYTKLAEMKLLPNANYSLSEGVNLVSIKKLDAYVFSKQVMLHHFGPLFDEGRLTSGHQPFLIERLYIAFNKNFYRNNIQMVNYFSNQIQLARQRVLNY